MARGGRGGSKRKGADGPKRLTKKQKKDLQEYGELHPADQKPTGKEKYKTVKDDDSSAFARRVQGTYGSVRSTHEDENASAYQQLLASIVNDALDSGSDDDAAVDEVENEAEEPDSPAVTGGGTEGIGDVGEDEDLALCEGDSDNDEPVEPALPSNSLDEQLEIDKEDYRAVGLLDAEDEDISNELDPFSIHFERNLPEDLANRMTPQQPDWCRAEVTLPQLGNCQMSWPGVLQQPAPPACPRQYTLQHMHVKRRLALNVPVANAPISQGHHIDADGLSNLQHSVFAVLNNYQDLLFCDRDTKNAEQLRLTYCIHALNHVLKTKSRVVAHNSKIKSRQDQQSDYRDQGLTRPKVLIVVPFRDAALRIVRLMTSLLMPDNQKFVSFKKRFEQEFSEEGEPVKQGKKPEDFEAIFSGNVDDHFRIGIGIAKKTIKLYSEFYSSDIIIASPLGLRTIIGAEGEENRDFDFLSSIEVVIFDQADVFLMQNWEHVLHLMNHLNLQPKEPHGVDFSRVRMWSLNGWSRLYRQTLIFSSISFPELHSLFNVYGHNFGGKLLVPKAVTEGSICQIVAQLPQVFQQIQSPSMEQLADARFNYFIEKVLPEHKDPVMARTFIFIPSYFDYVRLRNYFKKEKLDFVHLCEYSSQKAISRARAKFFHGKNHFFLFTERLHFFKRYQLRGICHLIFYELPHYSHYYSELCNMSLHSGKQLSSSLAAAAANLTCTVIYSRYEAHQLADIVGRQRASHMLQSQKSTHMFVTGDNTQ